MPETSTFEAEKVTLKYEVRRSSKTCERKSPVIPELNQTPTTIRKS
jgi:hypothetical protein